MNLFHSFHKQILRFFWSNLLANLCSWWPYVISTKICEKWLLPCCVAIVMKKYDTILCTLQVSSWIFMLFSIKVVLFSYMFSIKRLKMDVIDRVFGSCFRSWAVKENIGDNKYIDYLPTRKWYCMKFLIFTWLSLATVYKVFCW